LQYTIHFGLSFDDTIFPLPNTEGGVFYCGEKGLLRFLEAHLGLEGHVERIEHIRTEQYRQALRRYLSVKTPSEKNKPTVFYKNSFEADPLACAESLLARRDELLNAGFDFSIKKDLPPRLKVLCDIEKFFTPEKRLLAGQADRFDAVLQALADKNVPVSTLYVHNPIHLLPPPYSRLFDILKQLENPCKIEFIVFENRALKQTDLDIFKNFVDNKLPRGEKQVLKNDGSLLVLESVRDTDAAAFMAHLLQINGDFTPIFLIPDKNRVLDDALIQNGLPSFGLPSSSLGRPTLQLLKLVTAFLWKPIDPYKILEFVTMQAKPLDYDLGLVIANLMSQRPGIKGEQWFFETTRFFENLEKKAKEDKSINFEKIKNQYDFWFERTIYDVGKSAPKDEIISIFNHLKEWASAEFENNSKNTSFIVLSEQAKRVQEFLEELPASDKFLGYLELERIIRTIYEPAPVQPQACQVGHYGYFHKEACLIEPVDRLVWWNFTETEGAHFFSRWYKEEWQYLENQGIRLQSPQEENALMLWSRVQPIFKTGKQLILVYPKKINGEEKAEHPLMSHLRACFENFESIVFNIHKPEDVANFKKISRISPPKNVKLDFHRLGKTPTFVDIYAKQLNAREHETLTSLESMFYYPYQWVFRHKAKLSKSAILSIVKDNTLKGNIAHRFFELALKEPDFHEWTREDLDDWIYARSERLFQREAATLMMYGFEPERIQLINKIKFALWTLLNYIRRNNWKVHKTEMDLQGHFNETPVKGKADIVLLRGGEYCVLDLKWSGHSYRERLIKNGEDLQLVLYSRLLIEDDSWAHTAYFIIDNARLIARNTLAFNDIKPLLPDVDAFQMNQNIYEKMQKTFAWRIEQIKNGKVEIRTEKTVKELEEVYGEELLDVLEMRQEDAKFDDYRTLIGLVV
jgi:ATP-dependent helicase/nuclease subunit B